MLGVLVGAGTAGGWTWWLRSGSVTAASQAAGAALSIDMTNRTGATTAASGSTTTTTSAETTTTAAPEAAMGRLEVICREAWGASPNQGQLVVHRIERLTVHHTAVEVGSASEAPRRMRSYQNFHQESGWPDVAYHYLIDTNGHVYEGRPVSARGDTFTEYDPTGHFLVCCDGHFDQQGLPAAQLGSLADVLAWAAVQFGVGPSTIAGHGDFAATTCPGSHVAGLITDRTLQSMVGQRIAAGGVSLSLLCGRAGLDRVTEIEAGRL